MASVASGSSRAKSPAPRPTAAAVPASESKDGVDNEKAFAKSSAGQLSIYLIYVLVVLYAVSYQLQAPLEPFLVDKLVGKDNKEATESYGRLQSFFMVVQTVGSLTFGYLLDRFGSRACFVINFSACALTYLLLANTSSLGMLYLSKVPGIGMAGFLCAQAAVSQLTPDGPQRVAALGRLTTAYTVGGTIGPYCGGLLGSSGDYFLTAKVAVALSVFAAGLSFLLPTKGPRVVGDSGAAKQKTSKGPSEDELPWVVRAKAVFTVAGFLILMKLATSTANSMASSSQSLVLKNQLGFSEADMGFFMSCSFAFGGFANGFLLAPVTEALGGKAHIVVRNCIAVMGCFYLVQAGLRSEALGLVSGVSRSQTFAFIGCSMLLSIFQYSMGTSITAASTEIVHKDMKGTLIGMEHCIFSGARILTPAIGITILNSAGASALYATIASIFFACLAVWIVFQARFLPANDESKAKKNG